MIFEVNIVAFVSKSRGFRDLASRITAILSHFGITAKKFETKLDRYSFITRGLGCIPTFCVTAVTLKRHPRLMRELCQQGSQFAIHGYIHTDYSVLPLEKQAKHFSKAIQAFRKYHIPFAGFRAPFLRINDQTPEALRRLKFTYDSSYVLRWNVFDKTKFSVGSQRAYDQLLDFYQPREAEKYLALPRSTDGFIEIPVSIPDDEVMVDRLGITDVSEISEIWAAILQITYKRGELFTLQLHPERISLCGSALADVLGRAKDLNPPVWVPTLREIAEWWKERASSDLKVSSLSNGRYQVLAHCSDRATLLSRNCKVSAPVTEWANGYQRVIARDFVVASDKRPVIGVGLDSSLAAVNFLVNEGFVVERSNEADNYGIYLANLTHFEESDEKPLAEKIEQSDVPLLRYWRWPNGAKSALSVTGDIDSVTLTDFVLRIFENLWSRR
jgi:peptidoglycan/xylan/chitin deacetylase (PgdA/CDA1 family)